MNAFEVRPVLAALLLAAGLGQAQAADLLPTMPPPPPEPVPVEVGSGWYLRGDFTQAHYGRPRDDTRPDPNDPGVPPLVGLRVSDAGGFGGGVGYRINPWLRIDATVDQRVDSRFRTFSSRSNFVTGGNIETGRVDALTALVNVYADLGTWWGFTPYIGAGVGVADIGTTRSFTQTSCYLDACDGTPGVGPREAVKRPDRSVAALAWALTGGVSVALGHGLSLDAAYRYVDLGRMRTGVDSFGYGTRFKNLTANEFRIGLRYDFAALPQVLPVGASAYGN
jgi:opacity protein-like surface antigen